MRTSAEQDQIAPALVAAQAKFKAVGKSGRNTQQKYSYADLDDYLSTVRPILAEHGLALTGGVDGVEALPPRETRNGAQMIQVRAHVTLRLVHESGQWIECDAWGDGEDSNDKAIYKATTGGRKYAVASLLGLATTDDPEQDAPPEPPPPPQATDEQRAALAAWLDADVGDRVKAGVKGLLADARLTEARAANALAKLAKLEGQRGE